MMAPLIFKIKTYFRLIYVLILIKKSYFNIATYSISKKYRTEQEPSNTDLIYGELSICSFLYLLTLILKDNNPNKKIYDLGCGDGKLLLSAVLLFKNLQAIGIEVIAPLQKIASDLATLRVNEINKNNSSLNIFQDSFLIKDFSDGDIIYINSAALGKSTWDVLYERFNILAKDSYLISVENKITSPLFSLIYVGMHSASWGKARVYIYQKIK